MAVPFDEDRLAAEITDRLIPVIETTCKVLVKRISPACESPIEVLFGLFWWMAWRVYGRDARIVTDLTKEKEVFEMAEMAIFAQYPWEDYRIDWALKHRDGGMVFIECDGHDFHERTKEQAERDRSKDRAIQLAGIPILRFTGRELYRDPNACVIQAIEMLNLAAKKAV